MNKETLWKTTQIVNYSSLERLITRMDGTRVSLNMDGVSEKDWLEPAYFVPRKDGSVIVTFINSYFVETQV